MDITTLDFSFKKKEGALDEVKSKLKAPEKYKWFGIYILMSYEIEKGQTKHFQPILQADTEPVVDTLNTINGALESLGSFNSVDIILVLKSKS